MELRTDVIATIPTDAGVVEIAGQVWGVTMKSPPTYDVYDLAAREWHHGVPAERVRRVEAQP